MGCNGFPKLSVSYQGEFCYSYCGKSVRTILKKFYKKNSWIQWFSIVWFHKWKIWLYTYNFNDCNYIIYNIYTIYIIAESSINFNTEHMDIRRCTGSCLYFRYNFVINSHLVPPWWSISFQLKKEITYRSLNRITSYLKNYNFSLEKILSLHF